MRTQFGRKLLLNLGARVGMLGALVLSGCGLSGCGVMVGSLINPTEFATLSQVAVAPSFKAWQIGLLGGTEVYGVSVTQDGAGNYYNSGILSGSAAVLGGSLGAQYGSVNFFQNRIFVTKYDSSGALLWDRELGDSNTNFQGWDAPVTTDPLGHVYVVGGMDNNLTGDILGGALGLELGGGSAFFEMFVTQFDTSGNLNWVRQLGGAFLSQNYAYGVAADSLGNAYVTGYTASPGIGGGVNTQYGTIGSADLFVAKFDSTGALLRVSELGLAGEVTANQGGVVLDSLGNIYVAGFVSGSVLGGAKGTQYGVHGTHDAFVAKFDNTGALVWVSQLGLAGVDTLPSGLVRDAAGGLYMSGETGGAGLGGAKGTQYGANGAIDGFVAKFDSSGVLDWVSQLGNNLGSSSIALNSSTGNLYLSGSTGQSLGTQYGSRGTEDAYVAEFSPSGVLNCTEQLGLAGQGESVYSMILDSVTGGPVVAGFTNGSVLGGSYGNQYGSHSTDDAFIIKWISGCGF